jgi:hypothetical protein
MTRRRTGDQAELPLQRRIRRTLGSRQDTRIFRNNVGMAWTGNARRVTSPETIRVYPGDVVIRRARPFHGGLATGSADLIGWRAVTVTPEMVGATVGAFVSLEVKTPDGSLTKDQRAWQAMTERHGCITGVPRSVEDAVAIIEHARGWTSG